MSSNPNLKSALQLWVRWPNKNDFRNILLHKISTLFSTVNIGPVINYLKYLSGNPKTNFFILILVWIVHKIFSSKWLQHFCVNKTQGPKLADFGDLFLGYKKKSIF